MLRRANIQGVAIRLIYRDAIIDRLIESLGPNAFADFQARPSPIDSKLDAAALKGILNSDGRFNEPCNKVETVGLRRARRRQPAPAR
jgi:hypothetical protein